MNIGKHTLVFAVFSIVILIGFSNCGQYQSLNEKLNSKSCRMPDMLPTFQSTYHQFFKTNNCNSCHAPGTGYSGIPQFAHPDPAAGMNAFIVVGPDRIMNKLAGGHQAYDYLSLQSELTAHKSAWINAQSKIICIDVNGFQGSEKALNFFEPSGFGTNKVKDSLITIENPGTLDEYRYMTNWATITWNIDAVPGAEISMDVKADVDLFNYPTGYRVNNIKVKSPDVSLEVANITVLLNGQNYTVSTFKGINIEVPKSSTFVDLNPGGADAIFVKGDSDGDYANTDQWTLHVETLKPL